MGKSEKVEEIWILFKVKSSVVGYLAPPSDFGITHPQKEMEHEDEHVHEH
jgi:hypothetical protein